MKRRMVWMLCAGLMLAPASWAKPEHVPDGYDWQYYVPEHKLNFIQGVFNKLREEGVTMKYDALFYMIHLNWYYSEPQLLDRNIGDALADIALPLGDVIASD